MKKGFKLTESEKNQIKKLYITEESEVKDDRKFCHSGNVKTLDEIVGDDEYDDYIEGVSSSITIDKINKNNIFIYEKMNKFNEIIETKDEIVGDDEYDDYIEGVKLRKNGINGLVDRLELLKTLRLHPKISDGGEHLAYELMNHLKSFKPYNYFDESKKECNRAMDKIVELYKENEHGEELVKDIEKIYSSHHVSPRAKEFIKHSVGMIKGQ